MASSIQQCKAIARAQTGGSFLQVWLPHIRYLKGDGSAAAVLAHILNQWCMADEDALERNGKWMELPQVAIQDALGMKERRQRTALKTLIEADLIQTERRADNVTWVFINWKRLDRMGVKNHPTLRKRRPIRQIAGSVQTANKKAHPTDLTDRRIGTAPTPHRLDGSQDRDLTDRSTPHYRVNKTKTLSSATAGSGSARIVVPATGHVALDKDVHYQNATRLFNIIKGHGLWRREREPNLKIWAAQFKQLATERSQEQVEAMLTVHAKRLPEQYWPQLHSADSFCKQFDRLEKRLERETQYPPGSNPTATLPTTPISPKAKRIAARLREDVGAVWPDEKTVLPAIQASLETSRHFCAQFLAYAARAWKLHHGGLHYNAGSAMQQFAVNGLANPIGTGNEGLIYEFFAAIWEKNKTWRAWHGNLLKEVWHINHPIWHKWGQELAIQDTGSASVWERTVADIQKEPLPAPKPG